MEETNTALDHAWEWFKYHAEQRLTIIRFYFIVAGALGGGHLAAMKEGLNGLAFVIAVFGTLVSILFALLDRRVSYLVKVGEAAMAKEEEALAARIGNDQIKIVERADVGSEKLLGSYRKIFLAIFVLGVAAFGIAAWLAINSAYGLSDRLFLANGLPAMIAARVPVGGRNIGV